MFLQSRADDTQPIILPKPAQTVTPSGEFDGNDGKWSTFTINIGDIDGSGGAQNFNVLISTSSSLTMVPEQADWCKTACAKQRGIETFDAKQPLGFESNSSKAWKEQGQYNIPVPYWWSGTTPNGIWGSDNVGLGESSVDSDILASQWVVAYTSEELFMGSFGLAAGPVSAGDGSKLPFLSNFAGSNATSSTSFGYTAGAAYENNNKGTPGSLVLGGFDQSRFNQLGTSIPMISNTNNTLLVGVQSIIYHPDRNVDANDYSFTAKRSSGSSGFFAAIDSTLPYLWLPDDICDQFASSFRLTFDDDTELYTVNDTAHAENVKQNAAVTFKIGNDQEDNSVNFTSITLPYAAFDLQADYPIYPNATNYFPIRKSKNGVFVLGRTFLQESYIVVDYERLNFTVAPAVYSSPMPPSDIITIYRKGYIPPGASTTAIPGKKGGLAPGAVAGIIVGIVLLFLLLGLGAFFFWKKRRAPNPPPKEEVSKIDAMVDGTQVKYGRVSELDSDPNGKPLGGYYGHGRNETKDGYPPISEMESPPAELPSPPQGSAQLSAMTPSTERTEADYFAKPRRRGATRESSQSGASGIPGVSAIHELPGDDGQYQVGGMHFDRVSGPTPERPMHNRGPSDSSIQTNIDGVISGSTAGVVGTATNGSTRPDTERRPSHTRGASDTSMQSDTTAVSQPTPEEMENWALGAGEPRRPLSP